MRKIIALQNLGKYYPELYHMTKLQLTTLFGYTSGRTIVTTCEDTYHSNMDACDNAMYVHTLLSVFGGGAATLVSGPGGAVAFSGLMMTTLSIHSGCLSAAMSDYKACLKNVK